MKLRDRVGRRMGRVCMGLRREVEENTSDHIVFVYEILQELIKCSKNIL